MILGLAFKPKLAQADRDKCHYLARGGPTKVLEGVLEPHRLVIIEFPDMASLMGWYNSPEHSRLKAIRQRSAKTNIIALDGIGFAPL
jgi:uncharacterized protein (DUF1330 family)